MFRRYLHILAVLPLFLGCGMNGPHGDGGLHPATEDPIDPGDSAAVVAILKANGLSDTLLRHIVTVRDTRVVAPSLIDWNQGHDYLYPKKVDTIPDEIGGLGALETLYVWNQPLRSLPKGIGGLTSVLRIDVYQCSLMTIPQEMSMCTSTVQLFLAENKISSLPDSIHQMVNVESMVLYGNLVDSLPSSLGSMKLATLGLGNNRLSSLPGSIVHLKSIGENLPSNKSYLDLSNNKLCDLPDSIGVWADTYDPDWRESQTCK